jgi:hypothetical protein
METVTISSFFIILYLMFSYTLLYKFEIHLKKEIYIYIANSTCNETLKLMIKYFTQYVICDKVSKAYPALLCDCHILEVIRHVYL